MKLAISRNARIAVGLIVGAIAIAVLMISLRPEPVERERVELAPLVQALPLVPETGAIPVVASGTVQPRDEVVVGAQVSGRIAYVNPAFREGGRVGAGALLIRIEDADFVNQVRIAQADVAAQDVAVRQARQEVALARDEVRRFNARRQAVGGDAGGSRILPPADLSAATGPDGMGDGAREADVIDPLATREPQLQSAIAAKQRAQASLADARLSLGRTRVTAPFAGLVRDESAAPGTLVQPGQALGTLVATEAFEVRLSLSPDDAALIPDLVNAARRQIPATVIQQYNGVPFRWAAVVDRVDPAVDGETRNIEVFLRVPSPLRGGRLADTDRDRGKGIAPPPLLLGAFVTAEIPGAVATRFYRIPANALRPGNVIWVVRDAKLQIVPVQLLHRSDAAAYIVAEDIADGARIVTSSLAAPANGLSVRVAPGTAP